MSQIPGVYQLSGIKATMASADRLLKHDITASESAGELELELELELEQPEFVMMSEFCISACFIDMVIFGEPDREIARWKRDFDRGDAINAKTDVPPELCPAIVTLLGSPPNMPMFLWTHSKPSNWSENP